MRIHFSLETLNLIGKTFGIRPEASAPVNEADFFKAILNRFNLEFEFAIQTLPEGCNLEVVEKNFKYLWLGLFLLDLIGSHPYTHPGLELFFTNKEE